MPKIISSDVNFIIAMINELDELYIPSKEFLELKSANYEGYLLLIRVKKNFIDTFTGKIFDAFSIINRSILKITTRVRTTQEKISTLEVVERVEKEIQEAIRNDLANKNFINMILKEYSINSIVLDIKKRKEALEKFQFNRTIADEMLTKFKSIIVKRGLKFFDGSPPRLRSANKLIINKENELKDLQKRYTLFIDSKNKLDMEDLAISAEYLCHTEHSKERQVDFVTSDKALKKSLQFIKDKFSLTFDIFYVDRIKPAVASWGIC